MTYTPPRSTSFYAAVVSVIVICIVGYVSWYPLKERYFYAALSACQSWHGVEQLRWASVLAFDADVRRFEAMGERETAMTRCVNRWAGAIISDHVERKKSRWREVSGVLETSVTGQNYAPRTRIFQASYTKFIPADAPE